MNAWAIELEPGIFLAANNPKDKMYFSQAASPEDMLLHLYPTESGGKSALAQFRSWVRYSNRLSKYTDTACLVPVNVTVVKVS